MGKMGPTVNIVVTHARLRMAGMDNVGDTLLRLVDNMDLDGPLSTADVLVVINNLMYTYPEHRDTIVEMFTQPLF